MEELYHSDWIQFFLRENINLERIETHQIQAFTQKKGKKERRRFDVVLFGEKEAVLLEVKGTIKRRDVKEFTHALSDVIKYFPRLRHKKIYAGMAFLNIDNDAFDLAEESGLFLIMPNEFEDTSLQLINSNFFQKKNFNPESP